MNNKNKFFMPIFTLLFLANGITYGMNFTKQKIQNIIDNDSIEIKSMHANDQTELRFYHNDILVGTSKYKLEDNNIRVYLSSLEVEKEYRGSGIGEQLFYKTMREIHKEYPEIENVDWIMHPNDKPENISWEEAFQLLHRFYRRVGSTINDFLNSAHLNLKDAGYFDEQ